MTDLRPLSLAQWFEPPEEMTGHFGWLCGYSADADFLDNAAERFTSQTSRQRAYTGQVSLALLLDPGNPQLSAVDVPGVLHLALHQDAPFNLLHAKVALLGYRHSVRSDEWSLRLIVSTGNWTRETLETSLDLAWVVDVHSTDLVPKEGNEKRQALADVRAAWSLMSWLRRYFDLRALNNPALRGYSHSLEFESWCERLMHLDPLPVPKFIDNREASLLQQLPAMVEAVAGRGLRNYLGMGSGFYEAPSGKDAVPSVLEKIVTSLQMAGLLTKRPNVNIFVNPTACQAVAEGLEALRGRGWYVRPAGKPAYFRGAGRTLHAKFLFGCHERGNSNACNSPWLYLGSGNLTNAGFAQKASPEGGNLEAGVVLQPSPLFWSPERSLDLDSVVTNRLPIQWEDVDSPLSLHPGAGMPDREVSFRAAPVAFLRWTPATDAAIGGWLTADAVSEAFEVLQPDGKPCMADEASRFRWPGEHPRQVQVRWPTGVTTSACMVPVLDELGRLAAAKLTPLGLEEAWAQLASFPAPPSDDELADADPDGAGGDTTEGTPGGSVRATRTYPIREMMALIENIADRQTGIEKPDWAAWCNRLEQTLIQAASDDVVEQFRCLGLNPLSPLWHAPFRPDYAESETTPEGARYEEVLRKVEEAWQVTTLSAMAELA